MILLRLRIPFLLLFCFPFVRALCQAEPSGTNEIQKIKDRVTEFYTAVQKREREKAAEYIVEKSRSRFLNESPKDILGFRIVQVEMEILGKSAIVEMAIRPLGRSPFASSLELTKLLRWKFMNGNWFCDIDDPPATLGDKLEQYTKKKETQAGKSAPVEIQFDQKLADFGVTARGKIVTVRFPFTNLSSGTLKIEKIYLRVDYAKDVTTKREFKPKEKGEVVVDIDTSRLLGPLDHTIFVDFQPIQEMVQLKIKGKVFEPKDLEVYTPPN